MKNTTMKKCKKIAASMLLLMALMLNSFASQAQGCAFPDRTFPSANSMYKINSMLDFAGLQVNMTLNFTGISGGQNAPVNINDQLILNCTATVAGSVDVIGMGVIPVNAPATFTVRIKKTGQIGNQETFETEMTALDITGGTLPPGTMIRESPMFPSNGTATMNVSGGSGYMVNSFFDVFTELTVDGGQNWIPASTAAPMTMSCASGVIPTLSEWGLIIFGLLLLGVGVYYIMRRKQMMTA